MGDWAVHPMLRFTFNEAFIAAYEKLIGAPTITRRPIPRGRKRRDHLHLADDFGNVLFDPDTGLRAAGKRTRSHLMEGELLSLARARSKSLSLVFDQSLSRGQQRKALANKVSRLRDSQLAAFGYFSHACFVVASPDRQLLDRAGQLLKDAGVPDERLL
jgi:hypothetical protein